MRSEFRGGILTPNGTFTRDRTVIRWSEWTEGSPGFVKENAQATNGRVQVALRIGENAECAGIGAVILLDADGNAIEFLPVQPGRVDVIHAMVLDGKVAADVANAWIAEITDPPTPESAGETDTTRYADYEVREDVVEERLPPSKTLTDETVKAIVREHQRWRVGRRMRAAIIATPWWAWILMGIEIGRGRWGR